MSDARRRELERRVATGDPEAELALAQDLIRSGEAPPRFHLLILPQGRGKVTHMPFPTPHKIREGILFTACGTPVEFAVAAERLSWRLLDPTCKNCLKFDPKNPEAFWHESVVVAELWGVPYPLDLGDSDPLRRELYATAFEAFLDRTPHPKP